MKRKNAERQVFRYWVEIREVATGSVRKLPLRAVTLIPLVSKKNEPPLPNKELLQLQDGADKLEAKDLDDLRALLREKYPDAAYERTLHWERDPEREAAWDRLVDLLAEIVAKDMLRGGVLGDSPRIPHG
jgi:hypothetical protein